MKKFLAVLLAALMMLVCFAGCADNGDVDSNVSGGDVSAASGDMAYVLDKGVLVVGITDFAPMDYQEDGKWIGFDADMASAFAEKLGVDVEFIEIDWDNKIMELNSKSIDCVWNGMTLTEDVMAAMETSKAYCDNAQVVVVPAEKAADYQDAASVAALSFAVEAGSAGEDVAVANGYEITSVLTQADALMEAAAGTSDACIIDLLMAGAMIGENTSYPNLAYTVSLSSEQYGVGFRKGSDLAAALNEFFAESYADGSMIEIATTYGVQESLIAQ